MLNPVVSFEGRRRGHNKSEYYRDPKNDNTNKKTVAAGSTLATAIAANKLAKKEISADSVVLEMWKQNNEKDFSNISLMRNIIKTMDENKVATLSDANFKRLSDAGVAVAKGGATDGIKQGMTAEELKSFVEAQIKNVENNDSKLLGRKENAIANYENLKNKMEAITDTASDAYRKLSTKFEASKKALVDMFHLGDESKNADVKEIDIDGLKENVKNAKTALETNLIKLKADVSERMENIKLLDDNDPVKKAFKFLSKNKNYAVGGLIAAAVLSGIYLLFGDNKNKKVG